MMRVKNNSAANEQRWKISIEEALPSLMQKVGRTSLERSRWTMLTKFILGTFLETVVSTTKQGVAFESFSTS